MVQKLEQEGRVSRPRVYGRTIFGKFLMDGARTSRNQCYAVLSRSTKSQFRAEYSACP